MSQHKLPPILKGHPPPKIPRCIFHSFLFPDQRMSAQSLVSVTLPITILIRTLAALTPPRVTAFNIPRYQDPYQLVTD